MGVKMHAVEPQGLRGGVALVTGGSSGIGRACSVAFAEAGARVVISDVDTVGAHKSVHQVKQLGGEALFVRADVSRADQVERLIRQTVEAYGSLDYAHNNAGIPGEIAKTADCSEENWNNVINNNLKSVWLCLKYEIRQMIQQGKGVIVNTSSVYGLTGCERGLPAYAASKHGIIGLTKTAALEYAQTGIRVNAVCPGAINTPFRRQLGEQHESELKSAERYPVGRIGKPEEVAGTVVWLCSDAASFITGSIIVIDGGLTAQRIF